MVVSFLGNISIVTIWAFSSSLTGKESLQMQVLHILRSRREDLHRSTRAHNCLEIDGLTIQGLILIFLAIVSTLLKKSEIVFSYKAQTEVGWFLQISPTKVKDWHCEPCQIKQKRLVFICLVSFDNC